MRKIVTLLITLSLGRAFLQAQDLLAPKIEEAPVYIDSAGIHMIGELSIEQREIIKSEVIRLIEDFNNNVAKLCHPWTAEEKKLFTLKEREEYKNRIECEVRALFRADAGSYVTHVTSSYKVYKRDGLYYYQDQNHIEHRANNPYDDGNGTLRETLEEDITHQPARIEITNKFGSKCTVKTVHQYLNTIRNNSNFYKRVEFSGGEITSWDRLVFDAEKKSVCRCHRLLSGIYWLFT